MIKPSPIVMSAAEAAGHLDGIVNGNSDVQLNGFKPLDVAGESDLSFLHLSKYRDGALKSIRAPWSAGAGKTQCEF